LIPVKTAARMTAFRPGQSPPLVRIPMLMNHHPAVFSRGRVFEVGRAG
jgi:hypothetical protein